MMIKVCGMKYPDNIRNIARLKPDIMGLIFYDRSPRFVSKDISEEITSLKDIRKAGVFVNSDLELILNVSNRFQLDFIQLHGNESPGLCAEISRHGYTVIKAFSIQENFDFKLLEDYTAHCDLFLFDTPSPGFGGSGKVFNWELLSNYKLKKGFLLSGGLKPENIPALREFKHPFLKGYDINSGFESKPGLKKFKNVKQFIDEIRS